VGPCRVHGDVTVASGKCVAVLRITVEQAVEKTGFGQTAGYCQHGAKRECLRSRGAEAPDLATLRQRWATWQPWGSSSWPAAVHNGSSGGSGDPAKPWDAVSPAQRLCFDLKRALTSQLRCECDHCDERPKVSAFDMLGDGSCVFEERGCTAVDSGLNIGLGVGLGVLGVLGMLGLWFLRLKKRHERKRKSERAKSRWKMAGGISKGGGGLLGVMRAAVAHNRMLQAAAEGEGAASAASAAPAPAPADGDSHELGGAARASASAPARRGASSSNPFLAKILALREKEKAAEEEAAELPKAAGTGVAKPSSAPAAASVPAAPRSMPQPSAEKAYDAETEQLRQRIAELEQARPAGADIV
jgi:hypothetical protein